MSRPIPHPSSPEPELAGKPTPGPWFYTPYVTERGEQPGPVFITDGRSNIADDVDEGDAAFIVRACNAFEALVEAVSFLDYAPEQIVGAQGNDLILRIPLEAFSKAATALALSREASTHAR